MLSRLGDDSCLAAHRLPLATYTREAALLNPLLLSKLPSLREQAQVSS